VIISPGDAVFRTRGDGALSFLSSLPSCSPRVECRGNTSDRWMKLDHLWVCGLEEGRSYRLSKVWFHLERVVWCMWENNIKTDLERMCGRMD
jgi:hypothetical protein